MSDLRGRLLRQGYKAIVVTERNGRLRAALVHREPHRVLRKWWERQQVAHDRARRCGAHRFDDATLRCSTCKVSLKDMMAFRSDK